MLPPLNQMLKLYLCKCIVYMRNISSDPDPNKWAVYYTEKFVNALKQERSLHLLVKWHTILSEPNNFYQTYKY